MRIGLMLRTLDETGGIGIYTRYLVTELLAIDRENQYLLFYRSPKHLGRFSNYANVEERVLKPYNKALWDQVAVPLACRKERVDIVFHPKFTVPLFSPCKTIMVLHGADWFIPEQAKYYNPIDVRYIRIVMPRYCRKATAMISVSQLTTDNFNRILGLPPGKIRTVYFGPAKFFEPVKDPATLERVKQRYQLPDRFVFSLSKHGMGGGNRKNIDRIFTAYRIFHESSPRPHKLIIGGKDCERYRSEYRIPSQGYGRDILFPGWIEQEDLPAVYSLADLYLYPSNVEAFPIPLTEAMACGTPIVTSNVNGMKEIAGDAALFVDQEEPEEIADGIRKVISNAELRASLSRKGLQRSRMFNWETCAKETLRIIEEVVQGGSGYESSEQR